MVSGTLIKPSKENANFVCCARILFDFVVPGIPSFLLGVRFGKRNEVNSTAVLSARKQHH
jgi:hypothetical protein